MNKSYIPLSQRSKKHVYRRKPKPHPFKDESVNAHKKAHTNTMPVMKPAPPQVRPIAPPKPSIAPPKPAPLSNEFDWSGRSDHVVDIYQENVINTNKMNAENFDLHCDLHLARLILRHQKSRLLFEQLSSKNRRQTVASMCEYYDIFKPKQLLITCGVEWIFNTFCWFNYDSNTYPNLFNALASQCSMGNSENHLENYDHTSAIKHWKAHNPNYVEKQRIKQMKALQEDMKKYQNKHAFRNWRIGGQRKKIRLSDRCSDKLRFDLNCKEIPSIYLYFETKSDEYNFSISNYKKELNGMIDVLLKTQKTLSKLFVSMAGFEKLDQWFAIGIDCFSKTTTKTTKNDENIDNTDDSKCGENEPGNMIIKISLQLNLSMFLFYLNVYQMQWIKQNEEHVFQWWNGYTKWVNNNNIDLKHVRRAELKAYECNNHTSSMIKVNNGIVHLRKCILDVENNTTMLNDDLNTNTIPNCDETKCDDNNDTSENAMINDTNGMNNIQKYRCPFNNTSPAMALRRSENIAEKIRLTELLIATYEKQLKKQRDNLRILEQSLRNN